jgi:hypothetical protein
MIHYVIINKLNTSQETINKLEKLLKQSFLFQKIGFLMMKTLFLN